MSNLTELHEATSNSRFKVLMQKNQLGLRVRFEVKFLKSIFKILHADNKIYSLAPKILKSEGFF